jgi:two-component system, NtrC family, response regulator HydG
MRANQQVTLAILSKLANNLSTLTNMAKDRMSQQRWCITEFTSMLEGFHDPAVLISPDYEILATNRHYARQHGQDADSVVGRRCYEVSHHYQRPCHEMDEHCPMQASMESGSPQRVLHLHHTPQGEEHVDVELCPIHNDVGQASAFVEIMRTLVSAKGDRQKLVGRSPAFTHTMELVGRVAPSMATVLLLGESGTGKELAALAVHRASERANGPFVPVECSGLSESLFESELFGHEKGAFTGAHTQKQGLVESARGGTLFLDEIGDIPLNLQVKLLRLLETGTYRRVGSVEPRQAEFRLVCATHRGLEEMVEKGDFRRDLYFRISVFPIVLPALRERSDDLSLLCDSLLKRLAPGHALKLSNDALNCLKSYNFPGNIRELRNLLERAILLADDDRLEPRHFPGICSTQKPNQEKGEPTGSKGFDKLLPLRDLEQHYLRWAINAYPNDKSWLAQQLGVSERTLYRKLEKVTDDR